MAPGDGEQSIDERTHPKMAPLTGSQKAKDISKCESKDSTDNINLAASIHHNQDDNDINNNDDDDDGLSEYERTRLLRIERNQARLRELGLLKDATTQNATKSARNHSRKKKSSMDGSSNNDNHLPARHQPKRHVKTQSTLDPPPTDAKQKKQCGTCLGCTQTMDGCRDTCVYCVQRIATGRSYPRCLFQTCLRRGGNSGVYQPQTSLSQDKDDSIGTMTSTSSMIALMTAQFQKRVIDGNDDNSKKTCNACGEGGGYLFLCNGCQGTYHSNCHKPKIRELLPIVFTEKYWFCMDCSQKSKNPFENLHFAVLPHTGQVVKVNVIQPLVKCSVCREICPEENHQESIQCKACDGVFHLACHDPPLDSKPRGGGLTYWKCSACKEANKPILEHYIRRRGSSKPKMPKKTKLDLFEGEHDDGKYLLLCRRGFALFFWFRITYTSEHVLDCYICYNGGELVCCDFCPKAFHCECHIPPLPAIPTGIWKCCECYASERTRKTRCGECSFCLAEDCGTCHYCLDKPKFGGSNTLKKVCVQRECPYQSFAETFVPGKIPGELTHLSSGTSSKASKSKRKRPLMD